MKSRPNDAIITVIVILAVIWIMIRVLLMRSKNGNFILVGGGGSTPSTCQAQKNQLQLLWAH